jgi:hypothetical protein
MTVLVTYIEISNNGAAEEGLHTRDLGKEVDMQE